MNFQPARFLGWIYEIPASGKIPIEEEPEGSFAGKYCWGKIVNDGEEGKGKWSKSCIYL